MKVLRTRPKGYIRDSEGDPWESEAWRALTINETRWEDAWEFGIRPLLNVAEDIMGVTNFSNLDYGHTQEISEQFYAIFEDLILEYLRNHGKPYEART